MINLKRIDAPQSTITYDKNKIDAQTGNIYEAISIIAKRASQINAEIKRELEEKLEEFAINNDSLEEVFENKEHLLEEPGSGFLLEMIETFGFKPYIFNEFLYDKTKGNDFKEIEKIFDNYKGGKIHYYSQYPVWDCGTVKNNVRQGSMLFVEDEECGISDEKDKKGRYSLRKLKEYGNRFSQYFSQKREFEKIDWYEFKKFNNLHPVIIFEVYNAERKELEKMREKKYGKIEF